MWPSQRTNRPGSTGTIHKSTELRRLRCRAVPSGAIIVEGLEKVQPAVAHLPARVFVIRDQNVARNPPPGGPNDVPSWDLSFNYVPIAYPDYTPAVIRMGRQDRQLWRVVNAAADIILDL
jgi:hypothetical protein